MGGFNYGYTERRTAVLSELQDKLWRRESCWKDIPKTEIHGIPAKKRQVICGTDAEGSNGCGTKWFTLELPEDQLLSATGKRG